MKTLLHQIQSVPVLVAGDVVVDRYIFGTTSRISREAPVPVVLYEREEVRPGGAANAAVNAGALGATVTFLGVVGADDAAARFRECMRDLPVHLRLTTGKRVATAEKLRVLAGAQGTRHQQVLRLDRDPSPIPQPAAWEGVAKVLDRLAPRHGRAVLLSDYGHGLMDSAVLPRAIALAKQGLPVVVDSRYALSRVRGPAVLKPNAPELSEMVGAPVRTTEDVIEAARAALRKAGAAAVVATRGRDGMVVLERGGKPVILPAFGDGEVTDVTGAGDTVAATLTSALAAGIPLLDAARLANVAASIVVQKLGTATATPDEILAALDAHPNEVDNP